MGSAADHPDDDSSAVDTLVIVELCHISPPAATKDKISFPLTHFDLEWFHLPPAECLYFYAQSETCTCTPSFFNSVILPNLKLSLSAALSHFLPFAASIVWPSTSPTPFLRHSSTGVPLTVAHSSADFNHLSSHIGQARAAAASHPYSPALPSSHSEASVLALQVTLFPNQGFCLGISTHHTAVDGKSATLFFKAWAHLSKTAGATTLPEELTPFLDRSLVQDPEGLGLAYLQYRTKTTQGPDPDPRSLELLRRPPPSVESSGLVRATFLLSHERIQTLRERTMVNNKNIVHLSSFVLTMAHCMVCMVKAKRPAVAEVVAFVFLADVRARLDPALPGNYVGNCVVTLNGLMEVGPLLRVGGVGLAAERLSGVIDDLVQNGVGDEMARVVRCSSYNEASRGVTLVAAGSPRFHVYGADFGWGKPEYVELTSVDRTGAISLMDCRDGSRGIEVGLALTPPEMLVFSSAFADD